MSDETLPHPRAAGRVTNDPNQPREYTLCYREGVVRVFLRMDDRPIVLDENGLQWSAPNSPRQRATFEDIVRIRLVAGSDGDDVIGSCIIHFKSGRMLTVIAETIGACAIRRRQRYTVNLCMGCIRD